jgi:hypothetical protein
MNFFSVIIVVTIATFVSQSQAQEELGQGGCIKDVLGQIVCPPPGGGIYKDTLGQIVCGNGQCIHDTLGQIVCSSQPNGYATKDAFGLVVCTGGCEPASASNCQQPR